METNYTCEKENLLSVVTLIVPLLYTCKVGDLLSSSENYFYKFLLLITVNIIMKVMHLGTKCLITNKNVCYIIEATDKN